MKYLTHLFILLLMSFAAVAQDGVVEMEAETSVDAKALQAKADARYELWQALQEARAQSAAYGAITVAPSDEALISLDEARGAIDQQRYAVGTHVELDVAVDLEDEGMPGMRKNPELGVGQAALRDFGYVWSTSVVSEGASAVRIHFTDFNLEMGAAMYIYNDRGQAEGPYTGKGPDGNGSFWSNTIFGENVWVQIHVPGVTRNQDLDGNSFSIDKVSHLGEGFELARRLENAYMKADCSINKSCVENMSCFTTWNSMRKAVAKIIYEENGKSYICSGGLINDSYSGDRKPWFLTAYHCIDNDASASSIEALFQYKSNCGSCSASYVDNVLGSTYWSGDSDADFALLELSELPSSWGMFGWTTAQVRDDYGTVAYRISHPRGSPQSYSEHVIDDRWNNAKWIWSTRQLGTTEGGSSGAPIFISGGKVIGQLRGVSYTTDPYNLCDNNNGWWFKDGAFSYYWKSVRPYLHNRAGTYKMRVESSNVTSSGSAPFGMNMVTFKVVDALGHGVSNARVSISIPGGSGNGTTNASGNVVFAIPMFASGDVCVTNITHDYLNTYDSAANSVSCVTL